MSKHILVLEDDTANSLLLKKVLTNEDVEVDIASDAFSAFEKLNEKEYDLFIVDLNLPFGANGFDFLAKVRQHPKHKDKPVVAITAYIAYFDKEECLKKGFDYYFQKPFDINQFTKFIYNILNKNT